MTDITTSQKKEYEETNQHVDYVYGDVGGSDGEISETELELMSEIPLKYLVVCKYLVEIKKVTEEEARNRVLNLSKLSGDDIPIHLASLKKSLKESQIPLVRGFSFTEDMEFMVDIRKEDVLKIFTNPSVKDTGDRFFKDGFREFLGFVRVVTTLREDDKRAEELTKESNKRISLMT